MIRSQQAKQDFATRLSPETLAQLDALVKEGDYRIRTEAIEIAVERLYHAERHDHVRISHCILVRCTPHESVVDQGRPTPAAAFHGT